MDTNHVNSAPAPRGAQPTHEHSWELIQQSNTVVETSTYTTTSGHMVNARLTHFDDHSHANVEVLKETAFLDACAVCFCGINHEEASYAFLQDYLYGPELESICGHFDYLYIDCAIPRVSPNLRERRHYEQL